MHNRIKNLPLELQEHIYQYFWSNKFYKVLIEIKNIIDLDYNVNKFVTKNYNNITSNKSNYKKLNKLIEKISNNQGKMLLCRYNNLNLRFCNKSYIQNVCSGIRNDYIYIAPILICKSNYLRYQMLFYLKSL